MFFKLGALHAPPWHHLDRRLEEEKKRGGLVPATQSDGLHKHVQLNNMCYILLFFL